MLGNGSYMSCLDVNPYQLIPWQVAFGAFFWLETLSTRYSSFICDEYCVFSIIVCFAVLASKIVGACLQSIAVCFIDVWIRDALSIDTVFGTLLSTPVIVCYDTSMMKNKPYVLNVNLSYAC